MTKAGGRFFGQAGRRQLVVALAGLAALAAIVFVALIARPQIDRLTYLVFDFYQRAAPRDATDPPVMVVDIDESSIAEIGQWPWPRDTMAALVSNLTGVGAASIAFDIVFPEADRTSLGQAVGALRQLGAQVNLPVSGVTLDNDAAFATAIAQGPVVMGIAVTSETARPPPAPKAGFSHGGTDPRTYLPQFSGAVSNIAELDAAAPGIGNFAFVPSADNIIRTMPLVSASQNGLYPGLGMEALRIAQGASGFLLRSSDASREGGGGSVGLNAVRVGALDAPATAQGAFWLHYSGMPNMPVIPAAAILANPRAHSEAVGGRIVLIGTSAVGLRDIVATPVDPAMPGVFVHAELIDQIVAQSFLSRPDWAAGAELVIATVAGIALVALVALAGPILSSLGLVALTGGVWFASWWSFVQPGILIDPVAPTLVLLFVFSLTAPLLVALTNSEKHYVREAFGRYLSPTLVERLSDNPEALTLGGETRELTVLFSDIRGFTGLSENLDPTALTSLLNRFLTPMTDVLLAREATIDKYIGDAIMAFWNAPLDIEQHPRKACLAALDMAKAVERLNAEAGTTIRIGVGLNTGEACVGNLGSSQRFSYSAIGDAINLASRVEGLTKQYGLTIAVTEATQRQVSDLALLEADLVQVVGRAAPVGIYALLGDEHVAKRSDFLDFAQHHQDLLSVYRDGDFGSARSLVDIPAAEKFGLGALYSLYLGRIDALIANPPGPAWDGVFRATLK